MQANQPTVITGDEHCDPRGVVGFINDFDMKAVRRFYRLKNSEKYPKRGWRAHKIEQRWFYVLNGAFKVSVVAIDNWEKPSKTMIPNSYNMVKDNSVLYVPCGYATCIEALELNSEIILFADSLIEEAAKDNYIFPVDYFDN